jgi:hypothetical protein
MPSPADAAHAASTSTTSLISQSRSVTDTAMAVVIRNVNRATGRVRAVSLVALNGRAGQQVPRQLSGVKRTSRIATVVSACDPKRTWGFC